MFFNKIFKKNSGYAGYPNHNAKIAFIVAYPFQFYVYKNIYKHLADRAEFVVDLGIFMPTRQPQEVAHRIVRLLKKNNAHFRVLRYEDYFKAIYLKKFFRKYDVLVSLWERGCVRLPCNKEKKKVSMSYGAGKELTMLRPSRRMYDYILAYGPRDAKHYSLLSHAVQVGVPKFDDWFSDNLDREFLTTLHQKLDKSKKTILYLPTHGDLSSIEQLFPELVNCLADFNVITKLHYFNITETPQIAAQVRNSNMLTLGDEVDLLPLLKVSDVVVSDNSSAVFDAMLADKPIVVADFLSKEYIDVEHKKPKMYRRGWVQSLTYSGSIEQVIKRDGSVLTITDPKELPQTVLRALNEDDVFKRKRKEKREELFAFMDGQCGKRAADAIVELANLKELPEKPPLAQVLETFTENLGGNKTRLSIFINKVLFNKK